MNAKPKKPNKLKHVERTTNRRDGKQYYYFRYKGKRTSLPGEPGSTEFLYAYYACKSAVEGRSPTPTPKPTKAVKKAAAVTIVSDEPANGTIGAVIKSYRASTSYTGVKSAKTKTCYDRLLKRIEADLISNMPIAKAKRSDIEDFLDAETDGLFAWNAMRTMFRTVFKHAVKRDLIEYNMIDNIDRQKPEGERRAWTDEECEKFEARWTPGTRARLAYTIALCTSQRCGDIAKMTWDQVADNYIRFTQGKTGTKMTLPLKEELLESLGVEKTGLWIKHSYDQSKGLKPESFSKWFGRAVRAAGLPIGPGGCCLHGLRATTATRLALNGATGHHLMGWTGHQSLSEVTRYTKHADQVRLADESKEMLAGTKREKGLERKVGKIANTA